MHWMSSPRSNQVSLSIGATHRRIRAYVLWLSSRSFDILLCDSCTTSIESKSEFPALRIDYLGR